MGGGRRCRCGARGRWPRQRSASASLLGSPRRGSALCRCPGTSRSVCPSRPRGPSAPCPADTTAARPCRRWRPARTRRPASGSPTESSCHFRNPAADASSSATAGNTPYAIASPADGAALHSSAGCRVLILDLDLGRRLAEVGLALARSRFARQVLPPPRLHRVSSPPRRVGHLMARTPRWRPWPDRRPSARRCATASPADPAAARRHSKSSRSRPPAPGQCRPSPTPARPR